MNKTTNGQLLECLLDPVTSSLNDDAARKLIGLKADRKVQGRVAELARKCNEGELTSDERAEYETYVLAGSSSLFCRRKRAFCLPGAANPHEGLYPRARSLACRAALRVLPSPRGRPAAVFVSHRTTVETAFCMGRLAAARAHPLR
jgi:hypothetical protein